MAVTIRQLDQPPFDALVAARNRRSLQRLAQLADGRTGRRSG